MFDFRDDLGAYPTQPRPSWLARKLAQWSQDRYEGKTLLLDVTLAVVAIGGVAAVWWVATA